MSAGVLLVTADPSLVAAVPRLCALAGTTCGVERDSRAASAAWRSSKAVLVGADVAPALAMAGLPRRDRVVVLTSDPDDLSVWQAAVALGASTVFRLPSQEAELVDSLRASSGTAARSASTLVVIGGCGGAGASTFAAALAITASASERTLLLDGDPLGGGIDVLMGAESVPGLRWNELAATRGGLDPNALATAICDVQGMAMLSWGRSGNGTVETDAVRAVVAAAMRAFETVVIDLARVPSRLTHCLLDVADASVVIVPADVRAVAATAVLMTTLGRELADPHLVVRDPGAGRLAARDVAASLGLPLTATLRSEPSVQAAAQRGEPPTRRGRCALSAAAEVTLTAIATSSEAA
ncbi:MAG TPA: septum site-determining protein Ssd [Mycobacteriales bacterium]|nr:septum site-determining protein Ssd [Mycobacteriales bacterium]